MQYSIPLLYNVISSKNRGTLHNKTTAILSTFHCYFTLRENTIIWTIWSLWLHKHLWSRSVHINLVQHIFWLLFKVGQINLPCVNYVTRSWLQCQEDVVRLTSGHVLATIRSTIKRINWLSTYKQRPWPPRLVVLRENKNYMQWVWSIIYVLSWVTTCFSNNTE